MTTKKKPTTKKPTTKKRAVKKLSAAEWAEIVRVTKSVARQMGVDWRTIRFCGIGR